MTAPSETAHPVTPKAAESTSTEPRNFLVAFLLAAFVGAAGLRHFYTGQTKIGWIRLGLLGGGYVWVILFSLQDQEVLAGLGTLALVVAGVWATVDFFYVYLKVRNDAFGHPLTVTSRDQKWAKGIFWVQIALYVVSLALTSIIIIITLVLGLNYAPSGIPGVPNDAFDTTPNLNNTIVY